MARLQSFDAVPEDRRGDTFARFPLVDDGLVRGADQFSQVSLREPEAPSRNPQTRPVVG